MAYKADPDIKVFLVEKKTVTTHLYQVIASDQKSAEDAVHWLETNSARMPDARLLEEDSSSTVSIEQTSTEMLCLCGHFLEDHQQGCLWDSCSCKTKYSD